MSLSWDDDDASRDDAGWRTRLAAWLAPTPAELTGLAVLVVGALVLSGVVWLQATSRPTSFGPVVAAAGVGVSSDHDAGPDGGDGFAAHEIGARMDATGTADGPAPGTDGYAAVSDAGVRAGQAGDGESQPADARGPQGQAAGGDAAASVVVVHVTGAVRTTGLVSLPVGARIGDAVAAAGGVRSDALVERVNLARVLVDGEHIHVPAEGDDPTTLPPIGGHASWGASTSAGSIGAGGGSELVRPVHLNRATADELETLPGIGPARAEAIITHRHEQGPFATPGDLRAVSGIGEATFQRLASLITVE